MSLVSSKFLIKRNVKIKV